MGHRLYSQPFSLAHSPCSEPRLTFQISDRIAHLPSDSDFEYSTVKLEMRIFPLLSGAFSILGAQHLPCSLSEQLLAGAPIEQ